MHICAYVCVYIGVGDMRNHSHFLYQKRLASIEMLGGGLWKLSDCLARQGVEPFSQTSSLSHHAGVQKEWIVSLPV